MKRQIPLILVFVFGVFMVVQYFVPHRSSEWVYEYLLDWITIIGVFALGMGIWSLMHVSVGRIKQRKPYWPYSMVTIFGVVIMLFFGWTGRGPNGDYVPHRAVLIDSDAAEIMPIGPWGITDSIKTLLQDSTYHVKYEAVGLPMTSDSLRVRFNDRLLIPGKFQTSNSADPSKAYTFRADSLYYSFVPDSTWGFFFYTQEGLSNPMYNTTFDYVLKPLKASTFALLAFFIASAAYRAFRAHSLLASLLLLAAIIVMLRFTPGPWGDYMARSSTWIMNVVNSAAQRAILIGIGLGMVATALKVILGIERSYMGKG